MKKGLLLYSSAFLVLFAIIYVILSALGVGSGKVYTGSDNLTGRLLKDISSNPAVKGMEYSIILKTGPATANPYVKADVKTSADCVKCHFSPSINFHYSEHAKGSVKKAVLEKYEDDSCAKCHDVKAVDNITSDSEALLNSVYKNVIPGDSDGQRMIVTCIACHGSNGDHYNKINLSADDCASCHDKPANCEGVDKNPIAGNITSNFKASPHYASASAKDFLDDVREKGLLQNMEGTEFFVTSIKCLSCHQNSSFKKYYAETAYYMDAAGNKHYKSFTDNNSANFPQTGMGSGLAGMTVMTADGLGAGILCSTCHDLHSGSLTRKDVYADKDSLDNLLKDNEGKMVNGSPKVFSAEFNLCTQCHAVELDYTWDKEARRFDYVASPSSHDNLTGVKDPLNISLRTAKIDNGSVDITNANIFDYGNSQGKHLSYEGSIEEPIFKNAPLRKVLNTKKTIIDTHFKGTIVLETVEYNDADYILKRANVKGYNINAASPRPCTSCHDAHASLKFGVADVPNADKDYKTTADDFEGGSLNAARLNKDIINLTETWANSGHGDYKSETFLQDDFEARCMQCHSGYESAKFMTGKISTDKLDNISSYSAGLGGETVSCVTCHDLAQKAKSDDGEEIFKLGGVRQWASDNFTFKWINEPYADKTTDIIGKNDIEKIGTSTLCFNCHQGERPGRIISTIPDGDPMFSAPFKRKEFDSHYGAAASTFWGISAYEFPGKNYTKGSFPQHKTNPSMKDGSFKTKAQSDKEEKSYIYTCVDCHEFDGVTHSTKPMIKEVTKTADGKTNRKFIGINMTDKRKKAGCNEEGCHGEDGTEHAGKMQMNKVASVAAIDEVTAAFEKQFNLSFDKDAKKFVRKDKPGSEFTNWGKGQDARNLMGAANNIYLLTYGDKDAYAHNPIYIKQVLWDMMEMAGGKFSDDAKKFIGIERP